MSLLAFLSGAVTMGFAVITLFFVRFWRETRDSLFLSFALAFLLLGLVQGLLSLGNFPLEERSWFFLIRLAAFVVILVAVARKNLPGR